MSSFLIKPMETEEEINGKASVHYKLWYETYTELVDKTYLDNSLTLEKCVEIAHRWSSNTLIAKEKNQVIGYISYGGYRDDSLLDCGEIIAIYVLKKYQRQKVGYALMNAAFEMIYNYKRIALWVLENNNKAISFYEKYGFVLDGMEKKVILGKPLKELRMVYQKI